MTTIKVDVFLSRAGADTVPVTGRGGTFQQVVEWYKEHTRFIAEFYSVQILNISFSRDDEKLIISYFRLPECDESADVIDTCLSDPDDDGNYPLRIGNYDYLVIGEI